MNNFGLNKEVCDLFDPLACSACTPSAVTAPTDQCGITKTAGKEALWIFYKFVQQLTDHNVQSEKQYTCLVKMGIRNNPGCDIKFHARYYI